MKKSKIIVKKRFLIQNSEGKYLCLNGDDVVIDADKAKANVFTESEANKMMLEIMKKLFMLKALIDTQVRIDIGDNISFALEKSNVSSGKVNRVVENGVYISGYQYLFVPFHTINTVSAASPNGCEWYAFKADGSYLHEIDMKEESNKVVFSCFAKNEKNALRKFKKHQQNTK